MQQPSSRPGPFSVALANVDEAGSHAAIMTFARALQAGVFGARVATSPVRSDPDGMLRFDVLAQRLPDHAWDILSNLLHAGGVAQPAARLLVQSPSAVVADRPIGVRAFELAPPGFAGALDIGSWYEHVDDFRIEIAFAASLNAAARDAVCEDLEAWAALIDAGALPDPTYPDVASVIGGLSIRFEDPATALVEGEGMVCAPNAGATLLFALLADWPAGVVSVRFEAHR